MVLRFAGERTGAFHVRTYAMRGGAGELATVELDPDGKGEAEVANVDSLVLIVGRGASEGAEFELSAEVRTAVVAAAGEGAPQDLRLGAAYPNPFNRRALIPFHLPAAAAVELSLYNSLGQRVRLLRRGWHPPGDHQAAWDGLDQDGGEAASGTYLVLLRGASGQVAGAVTLAQ